MEAVKSHCLAADGAVFFCDFLCCEAGRRGFFLEDSALLFLCVGASSGREKAFRMLYLRTNVTMTQSLGDFDTVSSFQSLKSAISAQGHRWTNSSSKNKAKS